MPIDPERDPAKNTEAMRVAAAKIAALVRGDLDALDTDMGIPTSELIVGLIRLGGVLTLTAAEALHMTPEDFVEMITLRLAQDDDGGATSS